MNSRFSPVHPPVLFQESGLPHLPPSFLARSSAFPAARSSVTVVPTPGMHMQMSPGTRFSRQSGHDRGRGPALTGRGRGRGGRGAPAFPSGARAPSPPLRTAPSAPAAVPPIPSILRALRATAAALPVSYHPAGPSSSSSLAGPAPRCG